MGFLSREGVGLRMLVAIVWIALSSVGITALVRSAPPFRGWVEAKKKPWSCDICMGFWVCLLVSLVVGNWNREVIAAGLPAYGLCIMLLKWLREMEIPAFNGEK